MACLFLYICNHLLKPHLPGPIGGSHLEGTVWPRSTYAIQHDVEWFADNVLVNPSTPPPKEAEWRLRITRFSPECNAAVTGQLKMVLKFAFQLPKELDQLLESPFHPQSRQLSNPT